MAITITLTKGATTYNLHDMDGLGQNIIMDKTLEIRETLYSGEFKPTLNTAKWEILYNAGVFLASQEEGWLVSIKEDGTDLFTGYLRPANAMTYTHAPDRMPLEAVDTTVLIEGTYEGSTIISTAKKTPNPDGAWQAGDSLEEGYFITRSNGTDSLVHFLVGKTRFGDSHQIQVPDRDYLLNIFRLDRGEDIQKQLAEILWGHGLVYRGKEDGSLALYDWAAENPSPTFTFDGTNVIKKFSLKRKDRKTLGVTVGYSDFKRTETKAVCLSLSPQAEISHNRGGGEDRQYCWPPLRDQLGNVIDRSQFDIPGELLQAWQAPQVRGLRGEYAWSNISVTVHFKYSRANPEFWTSAFQQASIARMSVTINQDGTTSFTPAAWGTNDPILADPRPLIKECTFSGKEGVIIKIQGPNSWDSKPTENCVDIGSKQASLRLYVDFIEAKGDLVYYFHGEKDPNDETAPRVRTVPLTEGKSLVKGYVVSVLTSKSLAEKLAKSLDRSLSADLISFESTVKRPLGEVVTISYPPKGFSGVGRIIGITKKRTSSFWLYSYQVETTQALVLESPAYTPDLRSKFKAYLNGPELLEISSIVTAGLDNYGGVKKPISGGNLPSFDPDQELASGLYFTGDRIGYYDSLGGRWKNCFASDGTGYFSGKITAGDGLESDVYIPGVSGWKISGNGDAEFKNLTARGTFEVLGGSKLSGTIEADNAIIKNATGKTLTFEAGSVGGIIMKDGKLTGNSIIAGTIDAGSATIAGVTIENSIVTGKMSVFDGALVKDLLTVPMTGTVQLSGVMIKDNEINNSLGTFRVLADGTLTARKGIIGGFDIFEQYLQSNLAGYGKLKMDPVTGRFVVLDSDGTTPRTAMGFLGGLTTPDYPGGLPAGTFGFWASQNNRISFQSAVDLNNNLAINNDQSIVLKNSSGVTVGRFGTDSGIGYHLYNGSGVKTFSATNDGSVLSKNIFTSNVNLGRAGFIAYNNGNVAEWFIGQASGIDHAFYIQKKVSGTYTSYIGLDSAVKSTWVYGASESTSSLNVRSDSGSAGISVRSGESTKGYLWYYSVNDFFGVGPGSATDSIIFKSGLIGIGMVPNTGMASYKVQLNSPVQLNNMPIDGAQRFHLADNGGGDLRMTTISGELPGYEGLNVPLIKTGGNYLYYAVGARYVAAMGPSPITSGYETLVSSGNSKWTTYISGTYLGQVAWRSTGAVTAYSYSDSGGAGIATSLNESNFRELIYLYRDRSIDFYVKGDKVAEFGHYGDNLLLRTSNFGGTNGYSAIRSVNSSGRRGVLQFFDSTWGTGLSQSRGCANLDGYSGVTIGPWDNAIATFETTGKRATFHGEPRFISWNLSLIEINYDVNNSAVSTYYSGGVNRLKFNYITEGTYGPIVSGTNYTTIEPRRSGYYFVHCSPFHIQTTYTFDYRFFITPESAPSTSSKNVVSWHSKESGSYGGGSGMFYLEAGTKYCIQTDMNQSIPIYWAKVTISYIFG